MIQSSVRPQSSRSYQWNIPNFLPRWFCARSNWPVRGRIVYSCLPTIASSILGCYKFHVVHFGIFYGTLSSPAAAASSSASTEYTVLAVSLSASSATDASIIYGIESQILSVSDFTVLRKAHQIRCRLSKIILMGIWTSYVSFSRQKSWALNTINKLLYSSTLRNFLLVFG